MPIVSVIVPIYNSKKYLKECIQSILDQSLSDIEIILIDDGSSDGSSAICDSFAERDSRIKVIHKTNAGVSAARNTGLEIAAGDYVCFMDSDDWIESNMYESLVQTARNNQAEVVLCDCIKEYSRSSEIYSHPIRDGFYNRNQIETEYFNHLLIMENVEYPATISNWLLLIDRSLISDIRYKAGIRYSEDLLFGSQLLYQANSFFYMKGYTPYHYRIHSSSASHTWNSSKWLDYENLIQQLDLIFLPDSNHDFSIQINKCVLFFLYQFTGEILKNSPLNVDQRVATLKNVLSRDVVKKMFTSIRIKDLRVSNKQKLLTYCFKYQFLLKTLAIYFNQISR